MMHTATPFLLTGIILLHLGAFLLKWGWYPRRVGNTPHCGRCDYPLNGIEADRCPECGQHASRHTIRRGERHRRKGVAISGLVIALLGLAVLILGMSPSIRNANWYSLKPLGWVLEDLASNDSELQERAWSEIARRIDEKRISNSDLARLDETGARIASRSSANEPGHLVEHIVTRFDKLTTPQQDAVLARLLADLQSNAFITSSNAEHRITNLELPGRLSPAQHATIIELALKAQGARKRGIATDWLVDYLASREQSGNLTPAQRDRFFTQGFNLGIRARPDMLAGEDAPYWIDHNGRAPSTGYWSRLRMVSQSVDDDPPAQMGSSTSGPGFVSGASGGSIRVKTPGKHTLRVTIETSVYTTEAEMREPKAPPHWTRQTTLTATVEALAATDATKDDYITQIEDHDAEPAIRKAIHIESLEARAQPYAALDINILIDNAPYNVAFDIFAPDATGKPQRLGSVNALAGTRGGFGFGTRDFIPPGGPTPKTLDLTFRSSPQVARATVDLYRIWKGEVTFKDVPVKTLAR